MERRRFRVKRSAAVSWVSISIAACLIGIPGPVETARAAGVQVAKGSSWRYFKGTQEASSPSVSAWRSRTFDAGAWPAGAAPFGYGEPVALGTELADMQGSYRCVFLRQTFEVPSPSDVASLILGADFDDGFVAWINGVEVARANMPGAAGSAVAFDGQAATDREHRGYEHFELPNPRGYLVARTNVIAVQLFNASIGSDDILFDLELIDPQGADLAPPVVSSVAPIAGNTVRQLVRISVVFSEPVTGVDAADLLVGGISATGLSGSSPGPFSFTFNQPSPGTVRVEWRPDHGIADVADPPNAFAGGSWSYTLDPNAPASRVAINEFQASNGSTLNDEDGEWPDWVELYNGGDAAVNLEGWSLTDDPALPKKWVFPTASLASRAYLVVFASGKDRKPAGGGNLHTSFRIDAEGEYLGLFSPDSIDEAVAEFRPEFPEQRRGVSYGLAAGGELRYFLSPTPRAANGGPTALGIVEDPIFTPAHGVYEGSLSVSIETRTPGATIYYRMDPEGRAVTQANGTEYGGPLSIAGAPNRGVVVVRAIAWREGFVPSNAVASTYIFLDHVLSQPKSPPGFPATWGSGTTMTGDYELDPDVVRDPAYTDRAREAIVEAPTLSILMDIDDMFAPSKGIYSNATQEGIRWERPASAEFIYPAEHKGCRANCGIRIQGGSSTSPWKSPKLSLRLLFKDDYGPSKLRFPLFPDTTIREFDTIVLDAHLNQTWIHPNADQQIPAQYVKESFCDDTQNAMGSLAPHEIFVNLYINGVHWGMYNVHERPDDAFASAYLGGKEEEYDVLKHNRDTIVAGNVQAWDEMFALSRAGLATNANYEKIQEYLDVDDLCDYIMMNLYAGNDDWAHQNWYAARNRVAPGGRFRFFSWDAEHVLKSVTANVFNNQDYYPKELFHSLRQNAEYRLLFADHVQRHFFNGGPLYVDPAHQAWDPDNPERNVPAQRYLRRIAEIDKLIAIESARWGDYRRPSLPYTRDREWTAELTKLITSYFPRRSDIVLGQFRSTGMYPTIGAPVFSPHGGFVGPGFTLAMDLPAGTTGTIYYTTNGADPRVYGTGNVAPAAQSYTAPLNLAASTTVKARVRSGTTWSALTEAVYRVPSPYRNLRVSEIMYHPPSGDDVNGDDFEFLELVNTGDFPIDLTRVGFTGGIFFTFPEGSILAAGSPLVLVSNGEAFKGRYPTVTVGGVYAGRLDNDADRIAAKDPDGATLFSFSYADSGWWPPRADGEGRSLLPIELSDPPESTPFAWQESPLPYGSPGALEPAEVPVAPQFLLEPVGATVDAGTTVRFEVAAFARPDPRFQWQKDGVDIAGATAMAYTTPPLEAADTGSQFRCVVSNLWASVPSRVALVQVIDVPIPFRRGDANADGQINIADAVRILDILFKAGNTACRDAADVNDDGGLNIADPIKLLGYLFGRGTAVPEPFGSCGLDATTDTLGCSSFPPCGT